MALRWHAMLSIARRDLHALLHGWAFYATASATLAVAIFLIFDALRFGRESGLTILERPFFNPFLLATTLALLHITVHAVLAIARPREQGTLQVLFFSPVDVWSLVGAHCLSGIAVYTILLALLTPLMLLLGALANVAIPPALLAGLIATVAVAGMAVALGLAISIAAPSARAAVLLLIAVAALLFAVQGGYSALQNIPPTGRFYDALRLTRILLRNGTLVLNWISPFQILSLLLATAERGDWMLHLRLALVALVNMTIWFFTAAAVLRHRGVLP